MTTTTIDDDDGDLDPQDEFWSCCTGVGNPLTQDELDVTFGSLDHDGTSTITLDEFAGWMVERLEQASDLDPSSRCSSLVVLSRASFLCSRDPSSLVVLVSFVCRWVRVGRFRGTAHACLCSNCLAVVWSVRVSDQKTRGVCVHSVVRSSSSARPQPGSSQKDIEGAFDVINEFPPVWPPPETLPIAVKKSRILQVGRPGRLVGRVRPACARSVAPRARGLDVDRSKGKRRETSVSIDRREEEGRLAEPASHRRPSRRALEPTAPPSRVAPRPRRARRARPPLVSLRRRSAAPRRAPPRGIFPPVLRSAQTLRHHPGTRDYLLERLPKAAEAAGVAAGENGADDVEFEMKPFVDDLFSR